MYCRLEFNVHHNKSSMFLVTISLYIVWPTIITLDNVVEEKQVVNETPWFTEAPYTKYMI